MQKALDPRTVTTHTIEKAPVKSIEIKVRQKPKWQQVSKTQRRQQRRRTLIGQAKAKYRSGQNPKRLQRGLARKGVRIKKLKRW